MGPLIWRTVGYQEGRDEAEGGNGMKSGSERMPPAPIKDTIQILAPSIGCKT